MDKSEFQQHLLSAYQSGTLLTPKHDPDQLHITWDRPRSVLSFDLATNLETFLIEGEYSIVEYENPNYPASPKYWQIIPDPGSTFTVAGSGVPAYSALPSSRLDSLVAISGTRQGLHLFAEHSHTIQNRLSSGDLRLNGPLNSGS
jgi:hypothetical protein